MPTITIADQLNREITLRHPPVKVISLVPSQTELLFDMGLDAVLIGITNFCVHPKPLIQTKIKIGGTKNLKTDLIKRLQPDLILGNKEENDRDQIETLMNELPVWMSDIQNLHDALSMIKSFGTIFDLENKALTIINSISRGFDTLNHNFAIKRAVYLIWQNPFMVAGQNTFINDMLARCGFINAITDGRYPVVSVDDLGAARPDLVLLSTEPYPFGPKHVKKIQTMLPAAKVILVDGEMFSWYGSRLVKATAYFKQLITDAGAI